MVECEKCNGTGLRWTSAGWVECPICKRKNKLREKDSEKEPVEQIIDTITEVKKQGIDPNFVIFDTLDMLKWGNDVRVNDIVSTGVNRTLYQRAVDLWGEPVQLKMAIEECAELIKALAKMERFKNGLGIYNVAEEIADVEIMMEQLHYIFGDELIKDIKQKKLKRPAPARRPLPGRRLYRSLPGFHRQQ